MRRLRTYWTVEGAIVGAAFGALLASILFGDAPIRRQEPHIESNAETSHRALSANGTRLRPLLEQALQEPDEGALLAERQALEGSRRSRHAVDQQGPEPGTVRGEVEDLHPPVAG